MNLPAKIEISYRTILFTIFFLIFLWFLWQIKVIIFWVFVSFILMSAIKPLVERLENWRIPRAISVVFIFILLILLLVYIGSAIIPPFVSESVRLVETLPGYLQNISPQFTVDAQFITQHVTNISQNIVTLTVSVFSNIIAVFTIIIISFYMVAERKNLHEHLSIFMGHKGANRITEIISKIEFRLGAWVRGQLMLMLIIGLSTFIGLALFKLPFILPLAILAGILEIIPIIGPIIAAVPAVLVALTVSPLFALAVAGFYFLLQQVESQVVVPIVMKRAVGLPPLVTIIALMIGSELAGINGALLSIPVVVTIETVVSEYFKLQNVSLKARKPDSVSPSS